MTTPAGWYDDGSGSLRWWDGQQWTGHVRTVAHAPTPSAAPEPQSASAVPEPQSPAVAAEPEPFAPPYALPMPGVPIAADPTLGTPPFAPYAGTLPAAAPLPAAARPRRVSVLGIVGLATAIVGLVLACIPPVAPVGWVVLAAAFVVSLVSLFLRGTKWPGITGLATTVVGAVLAGSVALLSFGVSSVVEAGTPTATPPSTVPAPTPDDGTPSPDADPSTIEGVEMVAFEDLEVGDCLPFVEYGDEQEIFELPVVSCDQPHTDEVYFVYDVEDGEFPGDAALSEATWDRCLAEFETFVGVDWEQSELDFYNYQPTKASWNRMGDRGVQCIAFSYDDVTGSLRGAAR
jgi:hypothetical protein